MVTIKIFIIYCVCCVAYFNHINSVFLINIIALGNLSDRHSFFRPSNYQTLHNSVNSRHFFKFDSIVQFLTTKCDKCHNFKTNLKQLNFIEESLLCFFALSYFFFCPRL
jgi:hypothetical protein